ncbi:murein transglycosylase A [Aurantiacibacter poecillastricola]|uniref:murein transglycosylase A n=1 Tax=Aurantiacibacter poecillastricola TaxID=3064385 RepID=UPI00273EE782|nr:MltA domain-containing protein [Aurantiacibacter sp. 219JJ12-13]MDP5261054.1 MltA domain-containing protein [Aurantiacibacter sp. 219JJ12-13]
MAANCSRVIPGEAPEEPTPVAPNAALLEVTAGPPLASLQVHPEDASRAIGAFIASCHVPQSREDVSGLTQTSDWREPCDAAANWPRDDAIAFFEGYFTPVTVGNGEAFATGYFEPQIVGARTRQPGLEVPVYGVPRDLERCWREDIPLAERTGQPPFSRRLADGSCVRHFSRAEIEAGALDGQGLEIGWAADPVELFFLQIQGSGQLIAPDGTVTRIGYASQNGHGYTAIGGLLRQRGLLGDGPGQYEPSMQGIMRYIREHPEEGAALMRENASYVFFRVLEGAGPLGSIGVPVTAENSVAVDPDFVPYGAPVLLDLDRAEADGMWVAQDTGGAITGPNRFDTFWGAGERARAIAGDMASRGRAVVLLPRASATRLGLGPVLGPQP